MNPSGATDEPKQSLGNSAESAVACVELDRFCEGCGYNLRTLPVHREPSTGIPVVRCTECGRYHPGNDSSTAMRPWQRRLSAVLLGAWVVSVIGGVTLLFAAEVGVSYGTLEELTITGGFTRQQSGNTTTITWTGGFGPREIRDDLRAYQWFVAAIILGSAAIAFATGLAAVVLMPHWRRTAYFALVLGMALVAGLLVAGAWSHEAPHLWGWGLRYVAAHACAQAVGGLAGILFGRPVARAAVRAILPPATRPRLAYLWLADGKPIPHS
jgi:hypothetical protein